MTNRLGDSLSPYLRQHAGNPVEWWPWCDEAFAEARRRDVPVLLSVGYAACHWCHVMAHESFEDPVVAQVVNDNVVAIKVDREERPDIDAVYMEVTQALTGQGGWPMTVFLTPEGHPMYAGTYFPPEHFAHVVRSVSAVWRSDRDAAADTGRRIVAALREASRKAEPAEWSVQQLDATVGVLRRQFDDAHGGFGGAPKFPPSMTLEHLLRVHARTGAPDALAMTRRTCEAMARGGIFDQLDGGFARYSVDASWVVPHFEKMLYDNAQLLRVYAHLWRATGDDLARRVATQTAGFILRRLLTDEGGFASALDADTEGVEGLTYVWSPAELVEVLGEADGLWAAEVLGVTEVGTFEEGRSTLQLRDDPQDAERWERVRSALLAARDRRPQPGRDDKVVTSWNGLAIAALAEAGMILEHPEWVEAAERAARFVVATHEVGGRLRRTSLGGTVSDAPGCADDYGNLAEALLVLHQAAGSGQWLRRARRLLDLAAELFLDDGVHDSAADAEALFTRPRSTGDNAEPSGASSLASAAVMAFGMTGEPSCHEMAQRCLSAFSAVALSNPRFGGWALATMEALEAGPVQIAVVTADSGTSGQSAAERDLAGEAMQRAAWLTTSPGAVRVVGPGRGDASPLLADREARGGQATAYVCRGFVCDRPVTSVEELVTQLADLR